MAKKTPRKSSLADPSRLPPLDPDAQSTIQVIIETPKGSRNKYAFDPDQKVFQLTKVLPAGMAFPYDFGFIPSTKAEDGDPTDVLVQQGKKKDKARNDRIIAIENDNHSYSHVKHVRDLGKKFVEELEEFFVN